MNKLNRDVLEIHGICLMKDTITLLGRLQRKSRGKRGRPQSGSMQESGGSCLTVPKKYFKGAKPSAGSWEFPDENKRGAIL